jgi:predicted ester cyclase
MTTDIHNSAAIDFQAINVPRRPAGRRRWAMVASVAALLALSVAVVSSTSSNDRVGTPRSDREVVQATRRYDAALLGHDWRALEGLAAKDFTFHNSHYGSTQGRVGFLAWARLIRDAYPDFFVSIDRISFDNDLVTIWFHENTALAVAAVSFAPFVQGVVRLRIAGGSIAEMWSNYDEFGLLRQHPIDAVRRV